MAYGPDPAAPPTRLHHLSPGRVRLMAAAMFVGTTALLLSTLDMGFSRDESFYFAYGEGYQEWFVDVEHAETPEEIDRIFGRDAVIRTWLGNYEHPPLMKSLFGLSWRVFARKDRRASAFKAEESDPATFTYDLRISHATGFDLDADIILLGPQAQGQSPTDPARELARGVVVERQRDRARVRATGPDAATAAELVTRCNAAAASGGPYVAPRDLPITQCQGREDRALAIMEESTAFRLPGVLSGAFAVMLTFLFGVELFGWIVGFFGAFLFLFVPEHFYHAHVCCFDMPIVAATLFVFYAFWKSLKDPRWALVTALAWAIALLVKLNAFFIPASLLLWWLWTGRDQLELARDPETRRLRLQLPRLPKALLVMPIVALPVLFAYWPKLWYDPMRAIRDYFSFHIGHEHYMQYWFGEPLQVPPFSVFYPFSKTFFTYSEILIVLFFVGLLFLAPLSAWRPWLASLVGRARRAVSEHEKIAVYVLVAGLVPILVIALPSTPIFGGIKHWMPGAPFLALIAGYGLCRLASSVRLPTPAVVALALFLLAHPAKASIEQAWVGSSSYNSLFAGGLQGAADKRLMRAFWGHSTQEAIDWLNANAPKNARVFWQDTTWGAYDAYQKDGHLRHDIRYSGSEHGAQIALIDGNQAFWELDVSTRKALGVAGPLWIVTGEGVPYLYVYVRPGTLDPPAPGAAPIDDAPE